MTSLRGFTFFFWKISVHWVYCTGTLSYIITYIVLFFLTLCNFSIDIVILNSRLTL